MYLAIDLNAIITQGVSTLECVESELNSLEKVLDNKQIKLTNQQIKLGSALYNKFKNVIDDADLPTQISYFLKDCGFHDYLKDMSAKVHNPESFVKLAYISFIVWKETGDYLIERYKEKTVENKKETRLRLKPDKEFASIPLEYAELSPLISDRFEKYDIFDGYLSNEQRDTIKTVKEMIQTYSQNERLISS
ncbi:hypothetical protein ACFLYT_00500 [Nanoarchaeota archaeon]